MPDGNPALRLRLRGQKALGLGPYIIVRLDDRVIAKTMLASEDWTSLILEPAAGPGEHELSVEFTNDLYDPAAGRDRNVFLGDLEVIPRRLR